MFTILVSVDAWRWIGGRICCQSSENSDEREAHCVCESVLGLLRRMLNNNSGGDSLLLLVRAQGQHFSKRTAQSLTVEDIGRTYSFQTLCDRSTFPLACCKTVWVPGKVSDLCFRWVGVVARFYFHLNCSPQGSVSELSSTKATHLAFLQSPLIVHAT